MDPAYPTNRALLVILPLLAAVAAGVAFLDGKPPLQAAFGAILTGFAAWALTRELAPDDDRAAFVALALSFVALLAAGTDSVLLPFVALVCLRLVNRSTGLPARLFDTLAVLGFVVWAGQREPLLLPVAALAFLLDATHCSPLRRHLFAALVPLAAFGWLVVQGAVNFSMPSGADWLLLAAFAAAVSWSAWRQPEPVSVCDVGPDRLDRTRVRAGLLLGLLFATQSLFDGISAAWLDTPIWLCLAAVPLSALARQVLRT